MPVRRRSNQGPRRGFTLVELLTVIAIVAILATLLSSGLASAKRKARKTASMGNLHQIALAVSMYLDDHPRRPSSFRVLVAGKYLTERALLCPEDESGDWAGRTPSPGSADRGMPGQDLSPFTPDLPHSYFESFTGADFFWRQVQNSPSGGIAACQLHGMNTGGVQPTSVYHYEGLLLRALKDGAVVQRQFFWDQSFETTAGPVGAWDGLVISPFPFFLDPVESP